MLTGFYIRLSDGMDVVVNRRIQAITKNIVSEPLLGVTDVVPGYGSLYIEYDPGLTGEAVIKSALAARSINQDTSQEQKQVDIPVQYDGEDLNEVATRVNLSVEEVVKRHSAKSYHVYALVFLPIPSPLQMHKPTFTRSLLLAAGTFWGVRLSQCTILTVNDLST